MSRRSGPRSGNKGTRTRRRRVAPASSSAADWLNLPSSRVYLVRNTISSETQGSSTLLLFPCGKEKLPVGMTMFFAFLEWTRCSLPFGSSQFSQLRRELGHPFRGSLILYFSGNSNIGIHPKLHFF